MDQSTKARLERGKRTQEILKQGLHETLAMEEEAIILYSLVHGFLDDVPVEDLARFESDLYSDMKLSDTGKEIAKEIRETKVLPDSSKLDNYLTEFKKKFM